MVGLVHFSADALLKTISALQQRHEALLGIPMLLSETRKRVQRMRASNDQYSRGVPENSVPGTVLKEWVVEFVKINNESTILLETRHIANKFPISEEKVREFNGNRTTFRAVHVPDASDWAKENEAVSGCWRKRMYNFDLF